MTTEQKICATCDEYSIKHADPETFTIMKVSELEGVQLDAWVARADGMAWLVDNLIRGEAPYLTGDEGEYIQYSPSTDWSQGGLIIERERINIVDHAAYHRQPPGKLDTDRLDQFAALIGDPMNLWDHGGFDFFCTQKGPTPLIAAMRAYVASKFGDEVQDHMA